MGSFIHHDRIAEKLEMARTMGLVTDYFVAPVGPARRPEASVTVWRSPGATDEGIRDYLTRLLHGLVAGKHIQVVPPFVASEPIAEVPADEAVNAAAVPAAA